MVWLAGVVSWLVWAQFLKRNRVTKEL